MAVTIVATSGAANANSFVLAADADAYLATRLNASAFTGATVDTRAIALIEATRELNRLLWEGTRVTITQSLSWPRLYAIDPDLPNLSRLGDIALLYFGETVIPQRVKDATCELALEFLKLGTSDLAALDDTRNISKVVVGPIATDFTEPYQRPQGLARFPRTMDLIDPLLDTASYGGLTLVRI